MTSQDGGGSGSRCTAGIKPAPHRWVDAAEGRLSARATGWLERHAGDCACCAEVRARVLAARAALREIGQTAAPELPWDHIRARIYWEASTARRASDRADGLRMVPNWRSPAIGLASCFVAGAVAVAIHLLTPTAGPRGEQRASVVPASERRSDAELGAGRHESVVVAVPEASAMDSAAAGESSELLSGVVTLMRGNVTVDREPVDLARPIRAGAIIESGSGELTVQFDQQSGFSIGPQTRLAVVAFSDRRISLSVDGTVDVQVAPARRNRDPDRTLEVIAGARRVVVHGTVFRVVHSDGRLDVVCTRGHVVVHEREQRIDVTAGERLRAFASAAGAASAIPAEEIERLRASLAMPLLPTWQDSATAFRTTSTLRTTAPANRMVHVDGVAVARGSFALRVARGRHHVSSAGGRAVAGDGTGSEPGRETGLWLDLSEAAEASATIRGDGDHKPVADKRKRMRRSSVRRGQLEAALEQRSSRLAACVKPLRKQGEGLAEGIYVELELGVDRSGNYLFLNILERNVPMSLARCIRNVVDEIELPPGPRATLRKRISF